MKTTDTFVTRYTRTYFGNFCMSWDVAEQCPQFDGDITKCGYFREFLDTIDNRPLRCRECLDAKGEEKKNLTKG